MGHGATFLKIPGAKLEILFFPLEGFDTGLIYVGNLS